MTARARSVVFPSVVRWILIVSAIVYSVTVAVVLWNTPEAIRDMGEGSHRQAAYHLMDTGSYPTITHRVPGYPALIAALYSLFGRDNDVPLVLLIGVTSLATIYLTFRIGRHFFGSRGGGIAAAIVAADVCLLYRSLYSLSGVNYSFASATIRIPGGLCGKGSGVALLGVGFGVVAGRRGLAGFCPPEGGQTSRADGPCVLSI